MKTLFGGIALIILVGISGFTYRAITESNPKQTACRLDARVCPDGTTLGRVGSACTFPSCPPPNVALATFNIQFAIPVGYSDSASDNSAIAYTKTQKASSTQESIITIQSVPLIASSTPIDIIRANAIQDGSGLPAPATSLSSVSLGRYLFTVVQIGRFEGVVNTAYYLVRPDDIVRFDAIDIGVVRWADPQLDVNKLPAHKDLHALLKTLQGN